jgi:hypothetical protein
MANQGSIAKTLGSLLFIGANAGSLVSALPIPIGDEFITAVAELFILPTTVLRVFHVVNCQM